MEQWRPVVGMEGLYEVSDYGRVRSLDRVVRGPLGPKRLRGKILKPALRHGYEFVSLYVDGVSTNMAAHILTAAAFIGPRPDGHHTCHNDGQPRHNHVSNLRYDTCAANQLDKVRHGTLLRGEGVGNSKLRAKDVAIIRSAVRCGIPQRRLAEKYQVSPALICKIVSGALWKHTLVEAAHAAH